MSNVVQYFFSSLSFFSSNCTHFHTLFRSMKNLLFNRVDVGRNNTIVVKFIGEVSC